MTTATAEPEALPELTNDELGRYSRHLILPEVGMEGQQRLKAAKVLCVLAGYCYGLFLWRQLERTFGGR